MGVSSHLISVGVSSHLISVWVCLHNSLVCGCGVVSLLRCAATVCSRGVVAKLFARHMKVVADHCSVHDSSSYPAPLFSHLLLSRLRLRNKLHFYPLISLPLLWQLQTELGNSLTKVHSINHCGYACKGLLFCRQPCSHSAQVYSGRLVPTRPEEEEIL